MTHKHVGTMSVTLCMHEVCTMEQIITEVRLVLVQQRHIPFTCVRVWVNSVWVPMYILDGGHSGSQDTSTAE